MSSNSSSSKTTWSWWGTNNEYNKFYYNSGGGIDGYYCTNWDCNGSVTLVGNQSGTYYLHQLQYDGGNLNLQINGGALSIGGGGGNPPNVNITSYYGTHFTDNWNAQSVSIANTLSVNQTTLTTHGNHGTTSNNATIEGSSSATININDASYENFQNTTFSTENGSSSTNINFDSNNITFDHVTYDGGVHSTITDNGSLTFSNNSQFTLGQNSPFTNLGSNVNLSGVTFNINQTLNVGDTYNLLHTSKSINYNSYTSHLWDLIHYDGVTGSLDNNGYTNPSGGNGLYHVSYEINGKQYIFGETFNNNSISMHLISFIGPPQSIWDGVYSLEGTHNYEVGGGIGYVDSNNHELESFGGAYNHNFTININPNENFANGTLVLGNQTPTPVDYTKNSGSIWLGENDWNTNSITGTFNAHDIYMTNTFQTGNKWGGHAGGTVNMTFHAYNNLTLNDLHFFNHITAIYNHDTDYFTANKALSVTNSKFDANSGGTLTFNGDVSSTFNNSIFNGAGSHFVFDASDHQSQNPTITMQNSNFTGNLSSVAMQAKSIALTGVNFNNTGNSNISLSASQSLNLTNTSFNDGMASVSLNATNTLSDAGTSTLHAKDINVTAQTASFTNTTFELDPTTNGTGSFKVNNLTFNNDTFNGLSNYNFSNDGGSQNTTFQGTTTINTNNGQSPLAHLGAITLSNGARFDIKKALSGFQVGQAYQLLSGTSINYASDTEYAKNLWQMVHFGQASTTLDKSEGNDTYLVNLNLNGQTYQFQEQFSNNALSLTLTGRPPQDVWMGVYPLNGAHTYNVGNGIAYINPNVCNPSDEGCKNHTLSTYSGGTHSSATVNITGDNATLVIGNNQKAVATGGTINTANSGLEYHTSVQFNAANIYMTNNFQIGYSNGVGETGNAGFKAAKSMDMEGLNFTTYEGSHGVGHAYSTDWFEGDASMTINNSNFAATGGIMYFSSPTMNVNHSSFSGNGTTFDFNIQTNQGGDANHFSFQPQSITIQNSTFNNQGNGALKMQATALNLSGVQIIGGDKGLVSLEGTNITINNDNTNQSTLEGNNTNISLTASNALNVSNTLFNDPLNNPSSPQTMTLAGESITLNNDTFEGYSQYHFNTQNLTLQGTTSIATNNYLNGSNVATSPFSTYSGNVRFGAHALLNLTYKSILQALQGDGAYTLLSGKNINYASDTQYAKNLWQMVQFGGQSAGLATTGLPQGVTQGQNGIYYVSLDGQTIEENFGARSLTLSLIDQKQDVWWDVYTMTPTCLFGLCGHKTYNANVGTNGIAYIDPKHEEAEGWSGGNTLSTYTSGGNGMNLQVQGSNNTLVIGNDTKQAAKGGIVRLGGTGGSGGLLGYIKDTFNAANIFMTNTFQTGNSFHDGGGADVSFTATNNITLDGLNYQNLKAGTQHSNASFSAAALSATNSQFIDQTGGDFSFSASSITFTDSAINAGESTVTLDAKQNLTMASDAAPSTAEVPSSAINAKSLNVTAQTATFDNTRFTLDPTSGTTSSFKVTNLTFDNDTFNGIGSTYNFSGTQNTTFLGTTTISTTDLSSNPNSPFKSLVGNVALGSNALFNITSALQSQQKYVVVAGGDIKWSDDSYAKNLWNLVDYQGMSGTLLQNDGNNTYTVAFGGADSQIKAKETFSHNQITLTLLTQVTDLWPDVYNMTPGCVQGSILGIQGCLGWAKGHYDLLTGYGYKTYNVSVGAGGIAYIDPNLKNATAPYYNPAGKQLTAYSFAGNGGTYDIQGQGTLVLGNITTQAASGGLIQFGGEGANPGYIVDVFNAYNIYLTNGISVGNFGGANGAKLPYGGGADMTFNASNNLTTDGLTYTNNLTYLNQVCGILGSVVGSICKDIKPQSSNANFRANNTLSAINSNFSDHVADYGGLFGSFQFMGKQQVDFTGSNVQGNRTKVYVQGSQINLANSGFFLGDNSSVVLTGDYTDNLTTTAAKVEGNITATDTTFNLNTGSSATFAAANTTLSGNSVVLLNNGSIFNPNPKNTTTTSATFEGVTNITDSAQIDAQQSDVTFDQAANFSETALLSLFQNSSAIFNGLATFSGNSLINLDSNTTIAFNQGSDFTDSASVVLQGQGAKATFAGTNTFGSGTSIQVNAGASADATTGSVAFNGGHVNVSNGSVSLNDVAFNGAKLNIQGNSTFSANQVSSSGDTEFGLYGSGDLTFGSLDVASGILNIKSNTTPSTSPLISVNGKFDLNGLLNLSNINLSSALAKGQKLTYDIINAKDISGISGADGYQKIELYGMQIKNATYNKEADSWSFVNPLNGGQIITESVQDGRLQVSISQNLTPMATNLYNIAPELYFYKQSKQNTTGIDYNYTDNRVGTFFLDGQVKGVYNYNGTQEIPGTYDAYNDPNSALNIFNTGVSKSNLMALAGIATDLWPALEELLASGILNNLSDPNKLWQELQKIQINLTPTQKQTLLDFINGFDTHINQTFNNGTLVVGGEQVGQTGGMSTVWFGGDGFNGPCVPQTQAQSTACQFRHTYIGQLLGSSSNALGYIEAQFNAKDIYITGTVGSGNAQGTGGSAEVSFNSATNLVLNKANIEAQGTDQIFNLFGLGTVQKLLGQPQLGELLGQWIYDKAEGGDLIPSGLQGLIPSGVANATLGEIFNAQDMAALTQLPGFATVVKDILTHQSVSSLFGPNGLVESLPTSVQNEIDGKIEAGITQGLESGKLSGLEQGLVHKLLGIIEGGQGVQGIFNYLNNNFGNQTLWNVMDELAPWTNVTLNKALAMGDSPAATAMMQKFMDTTTFGQIFNVIFQNSAIINKSVAWLGPQVWGVIMDMAINDVLNPPKALSQMADDVGAKILDQIFGSNILNTLTQQKALSGIIGNIVQNKGLGGLWSQGLGALLPPNIKQAMEKAGVGSYLAPKGLSALWEKGYFTFSANNDVISNNSTYSNATGGTLSFIAGQSIVFNGTNNINFTNYQGTLNLYSNNLSNINLTSLNATDGLNLNAQFENLNIAGGQINLNQYESLNVSAQNFSFLGTITDTGGMIDFSEITGANVIGTLNLEKNSTLNTNNLSIAKAFNNQSTNAISVGNNLTLYSGATLTTQAQGINVGGALNSQGNFVFNLSNSTDNSTGANNTPTQNTNTPLIEVQGIATLRPTSSKTSLMAINATTQASYTLINANKWIDYNLYNQTFNPNSWKDYLTLYTYLNINGKSMQLNKQGNGLVYDGKAVSISDKGLLVSYQNAQGQTIDASIAFDNISVGVGKPLNVGAPNIEQYIAHIQGQSSVDAVYAAGGPDVMSWLNQLLVQTKNTPLFAPYYLENTSKANLVKIAKDISNSIDLVVNPNLKNNATNILQINTYTQQMSRLAKLSSFANNDNLDDFHDFLASIKGKRFASAVPNAMDVITAYSQRDKLKNNLWITGVGGASFVAGGTGTLYGINVGYDRFIKGVIVGGYAAYGYSGFHGNITNSASNNVNVGLYSRAFVKRSEITVSANETWGYNNAYISATDPILSIVNQRYDYSTWTTNLRGNYGYDFFFKNKRVILKPQIGLAYYYIGLSGLQGTMNNPFYNQFRANADPANKSVLTLNLALESRHYFSRNSYYFVLADIGRDLFVRSMGDKVVRFIGDDMLSYRNGGMYNTFAGLTTGGEVRLFRSFYINASIGARFGLDYQDINITGNVGMRYAF
ncbi:vacuolating cytotoxin domain-containing protein [Helicobacter ailurogastricus]|nr:vacuolating cytotoxin domain-containing protein [Helicobacter ailurogastricus]